MIKPIVALVGRPNVGKSTIFNRLAKRRIAIIDDFPGITRDRLYSEVNYNDFIFDLIDTGGIEVSKDFYNKEVFIQTEIAIEEADIVIFIVDGKDGLTNDDVMIRDLLKKSNKKVIVAINKSDVKIAKDHQYDFYQLGFDDYFLISAEHNIGFGDLLDYLVSLFKNTIQEERDKNVISFSIVGRPNVGKSSLVNALLNEERVIVSKEPGTTREAIDSYFSYEGKDYLVIDTAGIRKRGKIYERIEKYSVLRALKAISRSDVCLLIINAEEGIIEQDKHIASYILKEGRAVLIVVNKWDQVKDKSVRKWRNKIKEEFKFMPYAPIVFLSAKTKKGLNSLIPEILTVYKNTYQEIKTSLLNTVIHDAFLLNPPPTYKGRNLKIYFVSQISVAPPKFLFQVNNKGLLHFSYERYLENKLRENFDLTGTPIILQFKNRGEK